MTIFKAATDGDLSALNAAIESGEDVNARADNGSTALMYAAGMGRVDCVRALLIAGADVNARDKYDSTALKLARTSPFRHSDDDIRYTDIELQLLKAGAK
ncbi:MAG: ankyrin repeat domain-containing protein [Rhizomicrobium sp.]